ncbi:hypothetical protein FACS189425_10320 [Clostridia bacterium]|nr:hypothetical protein FACS189425_10320 [Clostridia bacterium]
MHVIPRRDVNPIAHGLINHFGTLANVFDARQEDLCKVEGVGEGAATLLKLVIDANRKYSISKFGKNACLDTREKLGEYCCGLQYGRTYETLHMICLNARKRITATFLLEEGTLDNTSLHVPKIIERAMAAKANSIVITHNHPGGLAIPSDNDVLATHIVVRALKTVSIKFEDHIIVGDKNEWISMRESKYI